MSVIMIRELVISIYRRSIILVRIMQYFNCAIEERTIDWMEYVMYFFFKQETAYEVLRSLVGSEMFIRDRLALTRTLGLGL